MKDYVLIAEPEARLARTFIALADEAKLESVVVRDGVEARKVVEQRGLPVLLVTNLALPRLDGFGLLEELRKIATPAQVPGMVVSSSMQLRTTASQQRARLGITEIAASGMTATALRAGFRRALAAGGRTFPGDEARGTGTRSLSPRAPARPATSDRARLSRIEAMGLVDDEPPDVGLQRLVEQTARSFGVPIALVSLVLESRQWFKAHVGLDGQMARDRGTPIEQSFCRHVVDADTATPLIVPDARRHPLFSDNPHVKSGTVGSYAGAPLLTTDGKVLGTLCIIDDKPLAIGYDEVDALMALARRVAGELELQSSLVPAVSPSKRPPAGQHGLEYVMPALGALDAGAVLMDMQRRILHANAALGELLGIEAGAAVGETRDWLVERWCECSDAPGDLHRWLRVAPEGPFVARAEFEIGRPARRVLRWTAKPVRFPDGNAQLELFTDVTADVEATLEDLTLFVTEDD